MSLYRIEMLVQNNQNALCKGRKLWGRPSHVNANSFPVPIAHANITNVHLNSPRVRVARLQKSTQVYRLPTAVASTDSRQRRHRTSSHAIDRPSAPLTASLQATEDFPPVCRKKRSRITGTTTLSAI